VTVAVCAATVLLFVLFAPALIVMGVALLLIGVVTRTRPFGRVALVIGVVWFVLGFTTSTVLLSTSTTRSGGAPARAPVPVRHS
jgi:uncharacterized membrane protein HdeD (DUF308 family)